MKNWRGLAEERERVTQHLRLNHFKERMFYTRVQRL